MPRNADVAALLYEIAEIMEIQAVPFKPRAYRRAAMNIETLGDDIEAVDRSGKLEDIPGVGKAIAEKVHEFLTTGRLPYLQTLRQELPGGLVELLRVPGVGPKTALRLRRELGIETVAQLEAAAKAGKLHALKGFGEKSEKEILEGIARKKTAPSRFPYPTVHQLANDMIGHLRGAQGIERAEAAGSLRRGRDTVGDLDILVSAKKDDAGAIVDRFVAYRDVARRVEKGATRAIVVLKNGVQVDLRVIEPDSFGAAWLYFTGSKEHNIALRTLALRKGWTVNEYALSNKETGRVIASATEEVIYEKLGLAWVPPELRENLGEIDAARKGALPRLVELKDLRGDLHTHTNESDGNSAPRDMVAGAARLGYDWYGISDHSKGLGIARGLDGARLRRQRKEIEKLQKEMPNMRLLQGCEVNIRKDGSLDLDRNTLAGLDYAIGSVHSSFQQPRKQQTDRVIKALGSGLDVLAHPSTRLLGERGEIDVDWARVFEAAKANGVAVEINASPFRLDLAGERVRAAREHGVLLVIDSDAHTQGGLSVMHYGVTQARRGGLEARHVLNALSATAVERHLGHARRR